MFVKVRVHPDARRNQILQKKPDTYEIHVKAAAERGQANAAVTELLAAELKIPAGRLRLIKGAQSPSKIFQVYDS